MPKTEDLISKLVLVVDIAKDWMIEAPSTPLVMVPTSWGDVAVTTLRLTLGDEVMVRHHNLGEDSFFLIDLANHVKMLS